MTSTRVRYDGLVPFLALAGLLGAAGCSGDGESDALFGAPAGAPAVGGGSAATGGGVAATGGISGAGATGGWDPATGSGVAATGGTGGTGGAGATGGWDPATGGASGAGATGGASGASGAGATGGSGGTDGDACSSDEDCPGGYCDAGTCVCWSPEAEFCNGQCIGTLWNDDHCGGCNQPCPDTEPSCNNGSCVCYSPPCGGGGTGGGTGGTGGGTGGSGGSTGGSGGSGATGGSGGSPPTGCTGYATRFWDCCKPHCGWPSNVPGNMSPMGSCTQSDASLGSDYNAQSSCNGGPAHMCYDLVPWAVSSDLAYGYAATSSGDVCGRCYELHFTGETHITLADPGSAALAGKRMIVQAINIGYDVAGGQFDLLVPGGGVGSFDACSTQWGVPTSDLGAQYGGFLESCKQTIGRTATGPEYKSCVQQQCTSVFTSRGLSELAAGCQWFVDWFEAADNPELVYTEVVCPSELIAKSGMDRTPLNDIRNTCGG